ncbi:MAG: AgmX/PglI C-terminal domain-containing protein [Deltaproteobacteria bacterium]|nr:AgmX/PglI C-terminal domain-containing protein [Deltaproteobacteria bacterium]
MEVDPEIEQECVVQADGSMTREAVQACIHARLGPVQQCYVKSLMSDRSRQGKTTLHLAVGASGEMESTGVSTEGFSDPEFDSCVLKKVRDWKWPARPGASGPLLVNYPVFLKTM